jgi:hypothetical protein
VRNWIWLGLLLLISGAACDRRMEPWIAREAEAPEPERPVRIPGLNAPIARSQPGVPLAAAPPPMRGAAPIRGTIQLAGGEAASSGGVLFLIARSSEVGPPLAVKRLSVGPFPMAFEIGPTDVMVPGTPFAGPIQVTARVDSDGNPVTVEAGELSGRLSTTVEPGARDLELVLRAGGG